MQQQSKKYLILILLIAVLVFPTFVSAAWWNPFSWGFWNSLFHRATPTQQVNNCIDTDGGLNYYVGGQASIPVNGPGHNPQFLDDSCQGNVLIEAYCSNGHIASKTYTCPNGCSNSSGTDGRGVCIKLDQAIEWKTYTNNQYGFEFQYPTTATNILTTPKNDKCDIGNFTTASCKIFTSEITKNIEMLNDNSQKVRFEVYGGLQITIVNGKINNAAIHKYDAMAGETDITKTITIGNKTGYEYSLVSAVNYKINGFMVALDDNNYLEVYENSKNPMAGGWEKIISSFKFITPTDQTADSKKDPYTCNSKCVLVSVSGDLNLKQKFQGYNSYTQLIEATTVSCISEEYYNDNNQKYKYETRVYIPEEECICIKNKCQTNPIGMVPYH